ncbi:MAG TPA: catalase family protein [Oculatellaceae cyanobacterium]
MVSHPENTPGPNEAQLIQQLADGAVQKLAADHKSGPMPRDAHPKSHGCVRGTFIIRPFLPEHLRVGIFGSVARFPCWIRFSNGSPNVSGDDTPDVRGIAIKLMSVPGAKVLDPDGTTQDFVLCNAPAFFVKNLEDYNIFFQAISKGPLALVTEFFFPSLNPFKWRLREMWNLGRSMLQKPVSPTGIRYWSQTPYCFGDTFAKYSVVARTVPSVVPATGPNRLRGTLVRELEAGKVMLDFMVQVRNPDANMPIDDARIEWNEKDSPFVRMATIVIEAQEFDTDERRQFDENLSFTPWHTLLVHQPAGVINRARRVVYQTISDFRHRVNGVKPTEPTA